MAQHYEAAGVNLEAGYEVVSRIKSHVRSTERKGSMGSIGSFGGMFDLSALNIKEPVLVSGTDGVGTKLKIAFAMDCHDTIGIDAVAMCVNDVLAQGAEPLIFLDYIATGHNRPAQIEAIVSGVAEGCRQAGCALVGGETAEMPGMYPDGEYDLAGFAVGVAEKDRLIDGSKIIPGDVVIGLASSGIHSNGYSLVRRIIEVARPDLEADFHGRSLADALMQPTRIYVKPLLKLMAAVEVKGMAHITGGGLVENIPRVLPDSVVAEIQKAAWEMPPLFSWLQENGNVADDEMHRVFNCGIGMAVIVAREDAEKAIALLRESGETVWQIGGIRQRTGGEPQTAVR